MEARPAREVVCGDALDWLRQNPARPGASVIATLPDVSELGVDLAAWRRFFAEAARLALLATPPAGLTLFFHTDNKREGRWVSKAAVVLDAAAELGVPQLFHKIVCRRAPGLVVRGRPGFSHLLGFSREARDDAAAATPDVLPDLGDMPWSHSIGTRAAEESVRAVRRLSPSSTHIVVPCCGVGTVLAVANDLGYPALGIERNRKRAAIAREFVLGMKLRRRV